MRKNLKKKEKRRKKDVTVFLRSGSVIWETLVLNAGEGSLMPTSSISDSPVVSICPGGR